MFINPYQAVAAGEGKWLKCNFHTHAGTGPGTCGSLGLEDVIKAYKQCKYNILTISNHDLFTPTEGIVPDIRLIHGVEYSAYPHMLTIGVEKHWGVGHQETIDLTRQNGGFVILCHPNWIRKGYWEWKEIDRLTGYTGIEILNQLIYRLEGSGLASDTWDYLLSQGKLVYGFGNDDFHLWCDLGRSYTMIYARSDSWEDIKKAIDEGCFYVSSGVCLEKLLLENNVITTKAKFFINSYIDVFTYRFVGEGGRLLYECKESQAEYCLKGDEMYIRLEVIAENGAMLFTQPVYNAELFKKP